MTNEQREKLIEILQSGQEIDPDWERTIFPPTRREYELVYGGKEREEEVLADTMAVPLQPVRTFGKNGNGWHNMLIFGDNLQVMRTLLEMKTEGNLKNADGTNGIKLAYIDPPFATKREFAGKQDERAYQDKVKGAEFVEFLRKRLLLIRDLLADDGSIYIHLDQKKCHYIKVIADEVFGENNFRNEIVWRNTNSHSKAATFGNIHQVIFLYSRNPVVKFIKKRRKPFKDYVKENFDIGPDGKYYSKTDLTAEGKREGDSGKKWSGYDPSLRQRHWAIPSFVYDLIDEDISEFTLLQKLDYLKSKGMVYFPAKDGGQPRIFRPLDDTVGNLVMDIWAYQPYTQGIYEHSTEGIDEDVSWAISKSERTGYPTQKPEGLLARIIDASSEKGDLVLDAFAGSGTTVSVAEKMGRRWVGIDCGKLSIYTIQKRLMNLGNTNGESAKIKTKPFTLYNAGLYDFSRLKELQWDDWRFFALNLFQCKDKKQTIGGIKLDGTFKNAPVMVFNHFSSAGAKVTYDTINDLHDSLGNKVGKKFFVIAPALCFAFQEDYVDKDRTRYYALRIPYSIINELHTRDFTAIKQPADEAEVNDTVESVGFDFIRTPTAKVSYALAKNGGLFKVLRIKIGSFLSEVISKSNREFDDLESLAMMMVDFDYDGDVFGLDYFCYGDKLKEANYNLEFQTQGIGERIMLVLVDIFGNEYREVKTKQELGIVANGNGAKPK